jgi:transposase
LREWLAEDHLAWFVLDAVDEIDLSVFYRVYREDGWGRAAFEPAMMVALLLYADAVGERSSRGIERRCREDVAFRVIATNRIPDHATIARFRARHEQTLAATLTQVLALCARAGLVSVGVVALDGSLPAGNASPGATRRYASIRLEVERMLAEAAQADAAEDEQLGEARGDELPAELTDARSRRERLRRCKQELERAQADEEAAYRANLAWRAAWEAEQGRRLAEADRARSCRARRAEDQHDRSGHAADEAGGREVGAGLQRPGRRQPRAGDPRGAGDAVAQRLDQLASMVAQAAGTLCEAGIREPIGIVLADGGYWNSPAIGDVRGQGHRRAHPHPGPLGRASSDPAKANKRGGSRRCSRDPKGRRSTAGANRSSSRSSRTRNASGAPTASCAAASPPARPNGS